MASTVSTKGIPGTVSLAGMKYGTLSLGVYATGGIAVAASQFGTFTQLIDLDVRPSAGYVPEWDEAAGKVIVYVGDNDNAADAPLVEVANATDLAAINFRFAARCD
jgi:hypothetical protein